MMEIKHNTPIGFNDMGRSTSVNSINTSLTESGRNSLPISTVDKTEVISTLKSTASILNDDIVKASDVISNGSITDVKNITGSNDVIDAVIDLEDIEEDLDMSITPEQEDELLADEDENNPKEVDKLLAEIPPVVIVDETAEVEAIDDSVQPADEKTRQVIGSGELRDPGDDLDTLISKINDIVEDCDDLKKPAKKNQEKENSTIDEVESANEISIIVLDDSFVTDKSNDDESNEKDEPDFAIDSDRCKEMQVETSENEKVQEKEEVPETLHNSEIPSQEPANNSSDLAVKEADMILTDEVEEVCVSEIVTEAGVEEESTKRPLSDEGEQMTEKVSSVEERIEILQEEESAKESKDESAIESNEDPVEIIEEDAVEVKGNTVEIKDDAVEIKDDAVEIKEDAVEMKVDEVDAVEITKDSVEIKADAIEIKNDAVKINENAVEFKDDAVEIKEDAIEIKDDAVEINEDKNETEIREDKNAAEVKENENALESQDKNVIEVKEKTNALEIQDEAEVDADIVIEDAIITVESETIVDSEKQKEPAVASDAATIEQNKKEEDKSKNSKADTSSVIIPAISVDDDSDDDIVFFAVKQPEATVSSKDKTMKDTKESTKPVAVYDDVVLLDDDDDDDLTNKVTTTAADKTDDNKTNDTDAKKGEPKEPENSMSRKSSTDNKHETTEQNVKEKCPEFVEANSDNACDTFDKAEKSERNAALEIEAQVQTAKAVADAEETQSNCSSSSNLLQESKVANSEAGTDDTDVGNDDEEDGVDNDCEVVTEVEIVENEIVNEESKGAENYTETSMPPAKRIRLSVEDDDSISKNALDNLPVNAGEDVNRKSQAEVREGDLAKLKQPSNAEIEKTANKRSREYSSDDGDKTDLKEKKAKMEGFLSTEDSQGRQEMQVGDTESKFDIVEVEDVKEVVEEVKPSECHKPSSDAEKKDEPKTPLVKAIRSHITVPLYPPPNFQAPSTDFSMDFFQRFKKSLDKMTKIDLEELVLQKIVEAVIHKSEFGEMREMLEKQETFIATLRAKLTELSKQFRDLEMVHSRVLRDVESKNTQFLMPVKITRAVGLQVFIPPRKNSDPVTNAAANSVTSTINPQQTPPFRTISSTVSLPSVPPSQRPSNQNEPSNGSSNSASLDPRPPNVLAPAVAAATTNSRRGCVQKITPQRPLDVNVSTSTPLTTALVPYRTVQPPPSLQAPQKLLNKSPSTPIQVRNRYPGTTPTVLQQSQPPMMRQQPSPTNQFRKMSPLSTTPANLRTTAPSISGQQYRRSDTTTQLPQSSITQHSTSSDTYMTSIHQLPSEVAAVNITPAKPKDKSVIDLTDEDDVMPSSTTAATPSLGRQKLSSSANVGGVAGGNPPANYLMGKFTNTQARIPSLVSSVVNKGANTPSMRQQMSAMYGSKSNGNPPVPTNISTPTSTNAIRIPVNSAMQRVKYGHPAPLPPTPTQNLYPGWKLPPPRPTIRISNLDNGIVISWTVEESMERHAQCVSYQIYAYQETSGPPLIDSWRHVGDVKAMLLPMAVTLTQFQEGQRYFFAVRAMDVHQRVGPFSVPKTWS